MGSAIHLLFGNSGSHDALDKLGLLWYVLWISDQHGKYDASWNMLHRSIYLFWLVHVRTRSEPGPDRWSSPPAVQRQSRPGPVSPKNPGPVRSSVQAKCVGPDQDRTVTTLPAPQHDQSYYQSSYSIALWQSTVRGFPCSALSVRTHD